ncbi:hypothetical protein PV396_11625 [Streptomyces sp. ME02-8801-2C]|nr:hypothetical protein [Streptomyces sp. ME02-8801-2C]MDX3452588.1 hypothetical protein [Streptomyces sp. ME02-8801-2C]
MARLRSGHRGWPAGLVHGLPAAVIGPYDDDIATTFLLSDRADLVGGTK